ncbi:DUF58 domain-containing protein [Actinomadura madurae]|uniref:DUF58 domain-containing protein n=1 Tax=Actinomadura madurae TaxID=1993 RepID=UPI000D961267|nr:DUF58 domain-containing protein [Actinomadura madurae]SPT52144.1 Uncharacterized conserved protein (some members contain a von Willebrand factor type A (vWA) domain) [Actinomadura madurae]
MGGGSPRPTRRGWGLLASGAVLAGGGLALGYLAPAALGVMAFPTVALAAALARRPRATRVHRRVTNARVRAGGSVTVTLETGGGHAGRVTAAERVTTPAGAFVLPLGRARDQIRYELSAERRGALEVGPLDLVRTDPLGLVRSVRRADDETVRLLVHPRHHELAAPPAAGSGGRDTSSAVIRATEGAFAGLREHAPGDDIRQIHWRTSARRGRLMVREHADSARPGVSVLVDDRRGPAELDDLAEAAASIVLAAPDVPVDLALAGGGRSPADAGVTAHLDLLAEAAARPDADFPAACARLRSGPRGRAVVLLPAAAAPADVAAAAEALSARRVLSLVGLVGPAAGAAAPVLPSGVRLLHADTPEDFAAGWNQSRWWTR